MIPVRQETNPGRSERDDRAQGILTSRAGKTSHAAVVASGMGKTCVCGVEALDVDTNGAGMTARTEPLSLLGEHRQHVERLAPAQDDRQQAQELEALLPLRRWDLPADPHRDGQAADDDPEIMIPLVGSVQ